MTAELRPLALVCAMASNRVIGAGNHIPWDVPEDRKHFVAVTRGHSVIMGRLTWESIGKPLPKRRNIVISRRLGLQLTGAEVAPSLAAALELARTEDPEPRVIGGEQIYVQALPLATRVYLSVLDAAFAGDAYFPELDPATWQCVSEERGSEIAYRTYERR